MGFLLPLLSFLIGSGKNLFKEPGVALTQQLTLHLRALTMVLASTVGSLVLLCVGISLSASKLATLLDSEDDFYFSPGLGIYIGLVVISAAVLFFSLKKVTWLKSLGFNERPAEKKSGALESAIALLVMDFVEERQSRRQTGSSTPGEEN